MNSQHISATHDEQTLITMASRGDLDAFNQLVLAYQNMAYHHAHALMSDPALAEDTTQESFIKRHSRTSADFAVAPSAGGC
jgi:RNA polymerase sigma-70 factor (ECF subfamily)